LISDLKITILGCGDIGRCIAKHLKQFGATTYGMVNTLPAVNSDSDVDEYFTLDDLPAYLKKSDYVCNVLPSLVSTRSLLTPELLSNCKDAIFINVGRGDVIKEEVIFEALDKGWFRQAILDVFEEPLPTESKLWTHPNITITPHCAGLTQPRHVKDFPSLVIMSKFNFEISLFADETKPVFFFVLS